MLGEGQRYRFFHVCHKREGPSPNIKIIFSWALFLKVCFVIKNATTAIYVSNIVLSCFEHRVWLRILWVFELGLYLMLFLRPLFAEIVISLQTLSYFIFLVLFLLKMAASYLSDDWLASYRAIFSHFGEWKMSRHIFKKSWGWMLERMWIYFDIKIISLSNQLLVKTLMVFLNLNK